MSFTTQGRIDAIDSRSVQPNPMNAQLTEIMRLITNLIRTGVVTEVDRENWLCRVKTGELETNWISWLTLRAGNARTWWRPSEGEQVVLLSLGGNLETAFALPAVYSNQFAPPSTSADACVTEHPDGGWFEYEPTTGRWYVRGIKSMVIEAADNITMKTSEFVLEADRTRINSEVVINGGVTWWGRMKTCWYLIALMPTGATPNERRKCSGNACNAVLRHSRYNWRKVGQISTRKCL